MGYSIDQDVEIMKEIERISQEPINESQYTAVRRGAKPIVESMAVFDDVKVDFNKWTSDSKKVNKAKTASTGSAKPITKNDTVEEKKKDGQVTEITNVELSKKKGQVVESKQESDGDKAKPAPQVKNFDSKAKSAAAANRSAADKEKHFAETAKKQKKFKTFIESLVVDEASRRAADLVLAEAEKVFKAQFESVAVMESVQETAQKVYDAVAKKIGPQHAKGLDLGEICDELNAGKTPQEVANRMIHLVKRKAQDADSAFNNGVDGSMPTRNQLKNREGVSINESVAVMESVQETAQKVYDAVAKKIGPQHAKGLDLGEICDELNAGKTPQEVANRMIHLVKRKAQDADSAFNNGVDGSMPTRNQLKNREGISLT